VIGKSIQLDGHPFTIIGVSARGFRGMQIGRAFDIAAPLGTEPIVRGPESSLDRRSNWWLTVFGRLAPGQTRDQAQTRLRDFLPHVREATLPPDWPANDLKEYLKEPIALVAGSTGISNLRDRYSQPLYVLLGVVGLVLTIACCSPNRWRGARSSPCDCHSAPDAGASCANCSSRASCSRRSAPRPAC
jgi:putative ABC transport system permease protein